MIYNMPNYSKISYDDLTKFAKKYKIATKELVYTADNLDEFKNICATISAENYKLNDNYIEGFVIEDNNNFMVKIKTSYYNKWKYLRAKMENALKNNDYKCQNKDKLDIMFMKYLQEKYENKNVDIKTTIIIAEKHEFEKNYISTDK